MDLFSPLRDFLTIPTKIGGCWGSWGVLPGTQPAACHVEPSRKLTSGFQKIPRLAPVVRSFNEVVAAITCDVVGKFVKNGLPLEWMDMFNTAFFGRMLLLKKLRVFIDLGPLIHQYNGGIEQCECIVILRDFPFNSEVFRLVMQ